MAPEQISSDGVIMVMHDEFYRFHGRGQSMSEQDRCQLIESDPGAVLAITVAHGGVDFVIAYCRRAVADRWGVYCYEPFRRATNPGLTRAWAKHGPEGMHIFRGVSFHLVAEEEWMTKRQ